MAYATNAQVQQLLAQFTIGAGSSPTAAQVTDIIANVAGEVDVHLDAAGVAVPVATPAHFVDFLENLNAQGAASQVLKSMFPDATGPGGVPAWKLFHDNYIRGLAAIDAGTAIPGAVATSAAHVAPSTYFTRNPDTEEDTGDIAEPMFKRDQVF